MRSIRLPFGLHLNVSSKNVPPVSKPHPQVIAVSLDGYVDTIDCKIPWHTQKLDSRPVWLYLGGLQPEPECGGYHVPPTLWRYARTPFG